jgi:hypothetical protein
MLSAAPALGQSYYQCLGSVTPTIPRSFRGMIRLHYFYSTSNFGQKTTVSALRERFSAGMVSPSGRKLGAGEFFFVSSGGRIRLRETWQTSPIVVNLAGIPLCTQVPTCSVTGPASCPAAGTPVCVSGVPQCPTGVGPYITFPRVNQGGSCAGTGATPACSFFCSNTPGNGGYGSDPIEYAFDLARASLPASPTINVMLSDWSANGGIANPDNGGSGGTLGAAVGLNGAPNIRGIQVGVQSTVDGTPEVDGPAGLRFASNLNQSAVWHEFGHMLGISHLGEYQCGPNSQASSIADTGPANLSLAYDSPAPGCNYNSYGSAGTMALGTDFFNPLENLKAGWLAESGILRVTSLASPVSVTLTDANMLGEVGTQLVLLERPNTGTARNLAGLSNAAPRKIWMSWHSGLSGLDVVRNYKGLVVGLTSEYHTDSFVEPTVPPSALTNTDIGRLPGVFGTNDDNVVFRGLGIGRAGFNSQGSSSPFGQTAPVVGQRSFNVLSDFVVRLNSIGPSFSTGSVTIYTVAQYCAAFPSDSAVCP